jgi:PII-like signaling protein/predicted transcriptional regulator
MATPIQAKRLVIYLGESDSWRGRSLYLSILETLRKSGIAGATVTRALAGFGAHSRIRTHTVEVLSMDLPIVIAVIDTPENIERALALVSPMVREGLMTLEDVQIIKYTHRYLQPLPADKPLAEIMTRAVTTVTPDTPAVEVIELLLGKMFKAVPVIDSNRRVVGIITDGDLLHRAAMPARLAVGERLQPDELREFLAQVSREKFARDIMTTPVVTARDDELLGHVTQRLLERGLKRHGQPLGHLARRCRTGQWSAGAVPTTAFGAHIGRGDVYEYPAGSRQRRPCRRIGTDAPSRCETCGRAG